MKKSKTLPVLFSIFLIKRLWQGSLREKCNKKKRIICRFYPTCSEYTIKALEKYGFFKGWILAYKRIKRCNNSNTESCVDYP